MASSKKKRPRKKRPNPGPGAPRPKLSVDEALGLDRAGRTDEAIAAYRAILEHDPKQLDAAMNLGLALARTGHRREAETALTRAVALHPGMAELHADAGLAYESLGLYDAARHAFREALDRDAAHLVALCGLARLTLHEGDREGAIGLYRRAIDVDPLSPDTFLGLQEAVYDERDPEPALEAITHAVTFRPDHLRSRFLMGILLDQCGQASASQQILGRLHPDPTVYRGAIDSWSYVKEARTAQTRLLAPVAETLRFAAEASTLDGLVVELGVRYGISARVIASAIAPSHLHGFDSFQGLPEPWHVQPEGAYSTHGELPDLPDNVELHVGLFEDTLGPFTARHDGPIRLANVDCALYSSIATVFDALGERMVPGTVIVFDEYLLNDHWREDEYEAFQEAVRTRGWSYEYLAFNLHSGQAVVRLT